MVVARIDSLLSIVLDQNANELRLGVDREPACQADNANGCPEFLVGCPASAPVLCSGGSCDSYDFGVSPQATLTHGVYR